MEDILKNRAWKEFFIEDVFDIRSGKRLTKAMMTKGNTPFVGASDSNNGITEWTSNVNVSKDSNVLGVNYNGSVGETFYHPYNALFSDDVKRFSIKGKEGNKYIYLFLKEIILKQKGKYEYGYKFNEKRMLRQMILLPVDSKEQPDYTFMEEYMQNLERKKIAEYQAFMVKNGGGKSLIINELQNKKWREFALTNIFMMIQRGKRLKTGDHIKGRIPYVSSTGINNGVDSFAGNRENVRIFNNCLTIANSGSVGATFYQPFRFIASDHVTKLSNNEFNKYVYLFISMVVSRLGEKYSFNRELNDDRIKKEKIMLPVTAQNEPDYEYMEQYMRVKEQEKLMRYVRYLENKK
ncbi:hypothetical protein FACS1894179_07940 [Bacteroidia bacterium]|nr:hypothetical protein FACS1894179_07940 [Bacteroidia bacterium]